MKLMQVGLDLREVQTKVADAVESTDAVNKGQVDTAVTGLQGYVDDKILGLGERVGTLDPASGLPTVGSGDGGSIDKNDYWILTADGTLLGEEVHKWEKLIALVDNPSVDADWAIEHAPHVADARYEFTGMVIPATVDEVLGQYTYEVTQPLVNGDSLVIDGNTITDVDIDVATNATVASQATKIAALLGAINAFTADYSIADDGNGKLTFTEKVGRASGVNLTHDETGIVGGNVDYVAVVSSVAYSDGARTFNHNLGYKYVTAAVYNDATDDETEFRIHLVDNDNLQVINESRSVITVSGVIHI